MSRSLTLSTILLVATLSGACTQESSVPGPAYLANNPDLIALKRSETGSIRAKAAIADRHMRQHRYEDAAALLRQAMAQLERKGPTSQPNRRTAIQMDLAEALAYAQDDVGLHQLIEASLAESATRQGFKTPGLASAQALAAKFLWIGGDREGADLLLLQAMDNLERWGSSQGPLRSGIKQQIAAVQADPVPSIPKDRSDFYRRCEAIPTGADQSQLEAMFTDSLIANNVAPTKTVLHPGPKTTTIRVNPDKQSKQSSCEFSLQHGRIIAAQTY